MTDHSYTNPRPIQSGIHNYRDSRVVPLPEHDMSEKKIKETSKDDRIRELEEALE